MFFGKPKITERDAAYAFVQNVFLQVFGDGWNTIYPDFTQWMSEPTKFQSELAQREFALAVLATQLQAVKNRCGGDTYQRVCAHVVRMLAYLDGTSSDPKLQPGFAVYKKVWELEASALFGPTNELIGALLMRCRISESDVGGADVIFSTALTVHLIGTTGGWWKNLLDKTRLVT